MSKRINANLPNQLADFVASITGKDGLYETPSEFMRDLIRRYMESYEDKQKLKIDELIREAIRQDKYQDIEEDYFDNLRKLAE